VGKEAGGRMMTPELNRLKRVVDDAFQNHPSDVPAIMQHIILCCKDKKDAALAGYAVGVIVERSRAPTKKAGFFSRFGL